MDAELSIYSQFFAGFWYAAVFPFMVGVYLSLKRALWASAFIEEQ